MKVVLYLVLSIMLISCSGSNTRLVKTKPWKGDSVYFFLVDKFVDGDKENNYRVSKNNPLHYEGGDFKGLSDNLDYIDRLGSSTLLFTPIMDNRNKQFFGHWGAHGYWIIDHYKVEEHFGDLGDFQDFDKKRKKMGKRIFLDLVFNHVDWDHPWMKEHPEWFNKIGDIKDFNDEEQVVRGELSGLPDLNQDVEEVYDNLLEYAKYWIDLTNADGIRLDAVKHIGHEFWKKFIRDIKNHVRDRNFLFLGELLHGDPNVYKKYIKDGMNAFFDYPLYYTVADVFARNHSMMNLASRLKTEGKIIPDHVKLATFVDNHDMPRFLSLTPRVTRSDLNQALLFYMTVRGIPVVYSGTESFMKGKTGEAGRQLIDLKKTPNAEFIAKIQKMRKEHNSLYEGKREDLVVNHNAYAYRKVSPNEESIVVHGRGTSQYINVPLGKCSLFSKDKSVKSYLTNRKSLVKNNKLFVKLKGTESLVFIKQGKSKCLAEIKKQIGKTVQYKVSAIVPRVGEKDKVYITGNRENLGNWNPTNGIELKRVGNELFEGVVKYEYKDIVDFKLTKVKADGGVDWEQRANRVLFAEENSMLSFSWDK